MHASFVIALSVVLGAALAQRPLIPGVTNAQTPILDQSYEQAPDGSYSFGYTSGDGSSRAETSVVKNAGTDAQTQAVTGSYSYISPEGTPVTVNYVADEDGYRASGNVVNPATGGDAVLARQRQLAATLGYNPDLYNPLAYRGAYPGYVAPQVAARVNPAVVKKLPALAKQGAYYPGALATQGAYYPGALATQGAYYPAALATQGAYYPGAYPGVSLARNYYPGALAKDYQGAYSNALYNRFYANGVNSYYRPATY